MTLFGLLGLNSAKGSLLTILRERLPFKKLSKLSRDNTKKARKQLKDLDFKIKASIPINKGRKLKDKTDKGEKM